jgi:hypothetical protein
MIICDWRIALDLYVAVHEKEERPYCLRQASLTAIVRPDEDIELPDLERGVGELTESL